MKKLLLLLSSTIILSGCSTIADKFEQPNCYESVAIAKISLSEAYKSAARLSEEEVISIDKAENTLMMLDRADQAVDSASAYCAIDRSVSYELLDTAKKLLAVVTVDMQEASNE